MVDPFPPRPAVAKVAAYIPITTPSPSYNPALYTGQGQSRPSDLESAPDDPFIARKPIPYAGNPLYQYPLPAQYTQTCDKHHEEERTRITRTILACISMALTVCAIIAVVVKMN
ncbi:hypothetical protein ONS95_006312 [Cadophora gregata]|uniref:uncharacterized protein n=1 Tax=Cadophora gregata TaxID=51156 RepID=UPI0026DB32C7|nr:uncharacterized protein ONS95_006312 [Cadophora gregata]KAK0099328.1 hypothetical protein ONS96_008556 [Cadophora gregata f. sp. sojae]KAK0102710.1 hypothetical protein ONS95_006312 [Cadophora gregata]